MKISVIGAGLGGLATSCLLARNGHHVTLFEKNDTPGGKMSQVTSNGFRFDTGPSLLTMPEILDEIFHQCGSRLSEHIKLMPLDPLCRYNYEDGTVFDSYFDRQKSIEAVRSIAPEDEQAYTDFLSYASGLFEKTASSFLYNPLQRLSDLRNIKLSDALQIDAFKTVSDRIDVSFRSQYMRQFFKRFTTYNGSSPYKAPATLNVIPHIELNKGGYYVDGGMYRIAEALEELAVSLGVRFLYKTSVSNIKVSKGSVTGIISNGLFVKSDLVVSNSDASDTYLNLIEAGNLNPKHRNKMAGIEPSSSGFVMLLGIDKLYTQLKHHNIFFSKDYHREFTDIFDRLIMPADPTIYIANTSCSNPEDAIAGGSNLFVLVNAPYISSKYNWEDQSSFYSDFVIKELENRGLHGLKKSIRYKRVINPIDFHKLYRSNKGSIYGTSSNRKLSAFARPGNKSSWFNKLYLTGGSTHPGGGVPLVLLSALHVNKLIEREHKY
ncbi:MAG: phytoene desaturase family protein [Balneolales bacterium]